MNTNRQGVGVEATEGTKVATLVLPIGLVGDELFFLDVSETLPPNMGSYRLDRTLTFGLCSGTGARW